MTNQTPSIAQVTEQPLDSPSWNEAAYKVLNDGAFAVLLSALFGYLAISRSVSRLIDSNFGTQLVGTLKQIHENQAHVETLSISQKQQTELIDNATQLITALQLITKERLVANEQRHTELLAAIDKLKTLINQQNNR